MRKGADMPRPTRQRRSCWPSSSSCVDPGKARPHTEADNGTVLAMVVDPTTYEVAGYTIRRAPIDLTALGQDTALTLTS